ncbi:ABC transporter ATP-binding protein [Sorangium sp. So ce1014]|uniref:ABC transporter ATP-binding protein n=1 Tax=Sorangium sp. So ce1014 TaxID=3133326 RepID=UPI003F61C315
MPEAIGVSGLRVRRGGRVVVDDVSFTAPFGGVLAVLGPNGAGKSSLLKALAGVVPFEGDIRLSGRRARGLRADERARLAAYVPQQSELRSPLTVASVVAQGRYAHHIGRVRAASADEDAVARALRLTDTAPLASRSFPALSHGERQRVLLARAIATEARILLLDEPTSALDVGHALRLYALLRRLAADGYCVVVVLHPLAEALDWTDAAVLMDRGRIRQQGETRDVIRPGAVESIYDVRLVPGGALGFRLPIDPDALGGGAPS